MHHTWRLLIVLLLMLGVSAGLMSAHKADAQVAQSQVYDLSVYTANDTWTTAAYFYPSYYLPNEYLFVRQLSPNSGCRWRLMYEISGPNNDYAYDGGHVLHPYDGWQVIGLNNTSAVREKVQVRCGPSFAGYVSGQAFFSTY